MAGLKGFLPKPPKAILATPMATRAPMTTIHIMSTVAGTLKANSKPVTTAEPSQMVLGTLRMNFSISHWKSTQLATAMMLTNRALMPK